MKCYTARGLKEILRQPFLIKLTAEKSMPPAEKKDPIAVATITARIITTKLKLNSLAGEI